MFALWHEVAVSCLVSVQPGFLEISFEVSDLGPGSAAVLLFVHILGSRTGLLLAGRRGRWSPPGMAG